jgi:hypothetical protein
MLTGLIVGFVVGLVVAWNFFSQPEWLSKLFNKEIN